MSMSDDIINGYFDENINGYFDENDFEKIDSVPVLIASRNDNNRNDNNQDEKIIIDVDNEFVDEDWYLLSFENFDKVNTADVIYDYYYFQKYLMLLYNSPKKGINIEAKKQKKQQKVLAVNIIMIH
jgi:hypothetical protein